MPGQPGLDDETETGSFGSPFFIPVVCVAGLGSAFDDLEVVRDLGRFTEHDAGRAVFLGGELHGLLDALGVERLAGDGEVDVDFREHLGVAVGAGGLQVGDAIGDLLAALGITRLYLYDICVPGSPDMLAIRLPESIEARLNALAQETGRAKSTLAREAILEYLDDLEDYYLAEARARKNRKTIPLEEVERALGL